MPFANVTAANRTAAAEAKQVNKKNVYLYEKETKIFA